MMYWVTYGSFQLIQIFTDMFIGIWFPFYYELKILFLIWLVSLNGHGARLLFTHVINQELTKHETTIDVYFDRTSRMGNEIIWRMWTECSKLAPKVISVFLRIMIATSEGLPNFDIASKRSTVDANQNKTLSITNSETNNNNDYNDPPMVVDYNDSPQVDDINDAPMVDDINDVPMVDTEITVLAVNPPVESDAISTNSDDLIKSVRVGRAKSLRPRKRRTDY